MNFYVNAIKNPDLSVSVFHEDGRLFCIFDKHNINKPDYRYKHIVLNCFKYRVNWIKG